jgi:hypothetical protein
MKTSGGVMCVKTAQIFMDFDGEKRILLNSDGTVFHYPATAHPDIGSITKHLELAAESHESKGWTWKHFNEVVLRVPAKKKKRKKK